jgi:hypothetical protein
MKLADMLTHSASQLPANANPANSQTGNTLPANANTANPANPSTKEGDFGEKLAELAGLALAASLIPESNNRARQLAELLTPANPDGELAELAGLSLSTHEIPSEKLADLAGLALSTPAIPKPDKRLPDRDRWLFVCFTPFTRTDIEAGAAGGTGPLDSDDIADIERGHYLTENRQQYLRDLLNQAQANRKVSR